MVIAPRKHYLNFHNSRHHDCLQDKLNIISQLLDLKKINMNTPSLYKRTKYIFDYSGKGYLIYYRTPQSTLIQSSVSSSTY